ncbi:MAG: lipoprotein NlpI [Methanoregula sp. PtaU1.Bin051]|nr:MAG: lipoprotein NlpI [Methanoregula sp. PtaU1.Bin051]
MTKVSCPLISLVVTVLVLSLPVSAAYSPSAVSLFTTGNQLLNAGNYTDAIESFDNAIALEPGYYEAWDAKADALNRNRQYSDALAASDHSLSLNPAYGKGWINRGFILYNLGRYDDEIKAYDKAIAIDPDNADAWFNKGYALAGAGDYDGAIQAFDTVAGINPGYPNLAANRKIAVMNRDSAMPYYIRYAAWIVLAGLVIACAGIWTYTRKTKRR